MTSLKNTVFQMRQKKLENLIEEIIALERA